MLENDAAIRRNADGLYIFREQQITDDLLDELKSERLAKANMRKSNLNRVASVPTAVVELWGRQGLDFWRMSNKEIVARLNAHDLGAFVTSVNV